MRKIYIVFATLIVFSCNSTEEKNITVLDTASYSEAIEKGKTTLIDVRTPEEYAEGHLENAVNVNYLSDDFAEKISDYKKRKPIYIYCRSGNRSGKAALVMDSLGFKKILDLEGGVLGWQAAGKPLVK